MGKYKIKVHVEIVECAEGESKNPSKIEDGSFEMNISEAQGISIDDCEQALLKTNYAAVRDALSKHLTEISKKKPASKGQRIKWRLTNMLTR